MPFVPALRRRLLLLSLLLPLLPTACERQPAVSPPREQAEAPASAPAPRTLELLFTYGSEKEDWIKEATAAFNAERHRTAAGNIIVTNAVAEGSGECIDELIAGTRHAHLTSPASGAYVALGNAKWRDKTGHDLLGKTDNLLLSPVVLAIWQPMAEALGWPGKPVGWADVLKLAQDPRGWESLGHPEWGAFKFGHTHPEFSNSGLIALLAECYAAAGKNTALTVADIKNPAVAKYVSEIEKAVVHYGSSTGFFGRKMFANGPGYLHAAVLYESMVTQSYGANPPTSFPVVAVYPKEGTFWSDHPVAVVERDWVTPEHREAARAYIEFLLAPARQEAALRYGFRPGVAELPLGAPIDAAHGADPKQPQNLLPLPSVETMDAALALWKENKKPAAVTLVLDTSGSMNDDAKIQNARAGGQQLVSSLSDRDMFSLMLFSNESHWIMQDAPLASGRARANGALGGAIAGGGTALYDSILLAYQRVLQQQAAQPGRIHAVVVLTDGEDTDSRLKLPQLLDAIHYDGEHHTARIFTIAYGRDADTNVLRQIADATQAKSYKGTPENIRAVFRDIATFF